MVESLSFSLPNDHGAVVHRQQAPYIDARKMKIFEYRSSNHAAASFYCQSVKSFTWW